MDELVKQLICVILLYAIEFIKALTYRSKIILSLAESAKTPKQLSMELGIHQYNVSATLRELKDKELVDVINPEAKKGRYYILTSVGEEISKELID